MITMTTLGRAVTGGLLRLPLPVMTVAQAQDSAWGFTGERSRLGWDVRLDDDRREYEIDNTRERVQGGRVSLTWRLQPRTRLFGSVSAEDGTFASQPGRDDSLYSADLGVMRDLAPRTTASLAYGYRERDSNEAVNDYRENRVTASLRMTF